MDMALIHRYLGETLSILAWAGLVVALFGRAPESGARKGALLIGRVFGIVLSVQWLLGIITYFARPADIRPSLAHPLLMTVLLAGFHVFFGRVKRGELKGAWAPAVLFLASGVLILVGMTLV